MSYRRIHAAGLALLVLPWFSVSGDAGRSAAERAPQASPSGQEQEPPPPQAPSSVRPRMREHFTHVAAIRDAVIRADLAGVREPASWLAKEPQDGLPVAAQPYVGEMQRLAADVAAAKDIREAASGMARLAAACGNCHVSVKANPTLMAVLPRGEDETVKGHMRKHFRAVEHLYRGLVVPSTHSWNQGVEALSGAPQELEFTKSGKPTSPEIRKLAQQLHAIAKEAAGADSQGARWPLYGKMLATCSDCHSLQGIVVSQRRGD